MWEIQSPAKTLQTYEKVIIYTFDKIYTFFKLHFNLKLALIFKKKNIII